MPEPAISVHFGVETRADYLDGSPSPWEPSVFGWDDLGAAIEQAEVIRANHVRSENTHRLDIRVVKIKVETVRVLRDARATKDCPHAGTITRHDTSGRTTCTDCGAIFPPPHVSSGEFEGTTSDG